MFAKLFIVALAVAAVAARPGISAVTSYSAPAAVVSAVAAPTVVAARSPYVTSTYHGVPVAAAPVAYSSYVAPAAVSTYSSAPVASYATYGAVAPVAYSTYGAAVPYTVY